MINRQYLKDTLPNASIKLLNSIIKVRGIGKKLYNNKEYLILDLYIPGRIKYGFIIVYIRYKFYIVENLKIKVFINNDILVFKKAIFDFGIREILFRLYNISISIEISNRDSGIPIYRAVRFS